MNSQVLALNRPSPQELFKALSLDQNFFPVCIDLDFTLLRTSSLYFFFPQAFLSIFELLKTRSWAAFKWKISQKYCLDPKRIPYRPFLIDFLQLCKEKNIPLVLATGAAYPTACSINTHLKFFDLIISSTQNVHCVGSVKAKALTDRYGKEKFYYFGDSQKDIFVWNQAHSVVALNPSAYFSHVIQKQCVGKRCIFLYDRNEF
ncbi:putative protein y4nM [Holospora obtusa F1]|uniref:Haloacid dehalogenase-like hydrolase n=1 Tax=Holospora obtusa F1 TaxID=1399147 RepID=W6TDZ9_HOLOB|nr:haloacid dehalogenase-like hydrolase [Holospora obtusa]ETZ07091.1 putative protein y4nM [Holospora obtusa F1]